MHKESVVDELIKPKVQLREASKKSAELASSMGRHYTVSVALPGSIIDNAQSAELRANLASQVARSMTLFNVDEVIIFDDRSKKISSNAGKGKAAENWNANLFLVRYTLVGVFLYSMYKHIHDFRMIPLLSITCRRAFYST
jgi:hypothetical protein